ncbi:McrC family protein [Pseudomonas protegens]|uniref:McrC family protein n=1 Tax=Pseudomonas protegens TaxID=380021 RepID=UPI001C699D96|nr:McrC family protein [Pseudomonas protegens]QYN02368.1 McrC family protein [Pseudomonas protegens]
MPETIVIAEFKEIDAPASLFLSSGEISAYPSIIEKNFFSIKYKKGKAVFQAGGYVGIIPVNSDLSIDIRPKVPIANLERIVFLSNHQPQILKDFKRRYDPHDYSSESLSDLIVECFLKSVEELCAGGLLKQYKENSSVGFFSKGRIDFTGTLRVRSKTNDSRLASRWFERGVDTTPNQFLKSVVTMLLRDSGVVKDKSKKRSVTYVLNQLSGVSEKDAYTLFNRPEICLPHEYIPSTKGVYLDAIALAKIILEGKGLSYQSGRATSASALVLNMAEAFEWYLLAVLQSSKYNNGKFKVLDGNKGGSEGGKKNLLDPSINEFYLGNKIEATPDIVIEYTDGGGFCNIVIDVKYKSIKKIADRDDVNQIISYAASYKSTCGVLVFPANEHNRSGLVNIGRIGDIEIFQCFVDLNSSDIEREEDIFVQVMASLTSGVLSNMDPLQESLGIE